MSHIQYLFCAAAIAVLSLNSAWSANKPIPTEVAKSFISNYIEIVRAHYADSITAIKELQNAVNTFVDSPSDKTLATAKQAWKKARDAYSPTEAFRFYGGPIDHPENGPEGLMNAWPLDEAYLDYVKGNESAGIINHTKEYPKITKDLLVSMNEKDGEKNISTGFHAIEFLLWGQDHSLNGPGKRPVSDYVVDAKNSKNQERRGQVLKLLSELLVEHIEQVAGEWKADKRGNYGETLAKENLDESLRKIYTGLISLSIDEMAGERMTVSLEKNDQENEQDCFSDYTVSDLQANEAGIQSVYYGKYRSIKGTSLHDVVKAIDSALAKQTDQRVQAAAKQLKTLPASFDQVIAAKPKDPKRLKAMKVISALEEQARSIAKSGLQMGLVLNIQ